MTVQAAWPFQMLQLSLFLPEMLNMVLMPESDHAVDAVHSMLAMRSPALLRWG
jgi:hypothetical protein